MKHAGIFTSFAAASLVLGLAAPVSAQSESTKSSTQPPGHGSSKSSVAAQQCRNDLQAFGSEMRKDGFWLNGWRAGYAVMPPIPPATPPVQGSNPSGHPAAPGTTAGGPWGNVNWHDRPGQSLRTLWFAADILAQRGKQQGCETVLSAARDVYSHYVSDLRARGIEPSNVAGWRRAQIGSAKPVNELTTAFRADELIGMDVRNTKDQQLGSVDDVVINPQTGKIGYVVLSRSGFLGIGEDYVAVPWNDLEATPGLNTLVLKASQSAVDNAPDVDPDRFTNDGQFEQMRQKVDAYWKSQAQSSSG
jgi:sporulation protein YlmC with PRC-barrel domain